MLCMTRPYSFLFSDAFCTTINPVVRLNLPDLKLGSVQEEESVELDTAIVQTRKLEFIQYNKQVKDERESKIIKKESDLLTREDLIRNCLNIDIRI